MLCHQSSDKCIVSSHQNSFQYHGTTSTCNCSVSSANTSVTSVTVKTITWPPCLHLASLNFPFQKPSTSPHSPHPPPQPHLTYLTCHPLLPGPCLPAPPTPTSNLPTGNFITTCHLGKTSSGKCCSTMAFCRSGFAPPPLIFGSYGCLETLLILVTKKGEKQNFLKHPK